MIDTYTYKYGHLYNIKYKNCKLFPVWQWQGLFRKTQTFNLIYRTYDIMKNIYK